MSTTGGQQEARNIAPFHKRFNVPIKAGEARRRFMTRCYNLMAHFLEDVRLNRGYPYIYASIATELGITYDTFDLKKCLEGDFHTCLRTLEAIYRSVKGKEQRDLVSGINIAMSLSEIDLGVQFKDSVFRKSGANVLDEELVNEPLQWLSDAKYKTVLEPFEKGLSDFLLTTKETERHKDVVTDMYEALEAMAKVVCQNDKDLSANRESFVSMLGLSEYYRKILKDFIEFGCEFRHGEGQKKPRIKLTTQEVEAFVYMTGLFIRLAIERLRAIE